MKNPPVAVLIARLERVLAEINARLLSHPDEKCLRLVEDARTLAEQVREGL